MRSSVLAFLALVPFVACSSSKQDGPGKKKKEDPYSTPTKLCSAWAKAACNDDVVSACAAQSPDDCVNRQSQFCKNLLPTFEYSSEGAEDCLEAIEEAFADAKLSSEEQGVALGLAPPCDLFEAGTGADGDSCEDDTDCNKDDGLECVRRAGDSMGTCRVPEVVGGGFPCTEPHQICDEQFYCDGNNCIAKVAQEGAPCSAQTPCAPSFKCEGADGMMTCRAKEGLGGACFDDTDCASGLCQRPAGSSTGVCASEIILSPTDSICENFR